jgi:cobalt/nickel transport system permease protein
MAGLSHHALELTGPAGDLDSPVHRRDPRAKLLGLLGVTVVAVSTPVTAWPVLAACAGVLTAVAAAARVPARELWRRGRLVLVPVLLVACLLPLLRTGGATYALGPLVLHEAGLLVLAAVAAKATIGTASAVLLGSTTSFPALLAGLEAMRAPRLLVLIAGFMYRYLFVLAAEVERMRAALVARAFRPRHALASAPLGRLAAALFLRTYGRGERVYLAMLARGYHGRMPRLAPLAFTRADAAFVALVLVAVLPLRLLAGGLP